MEVSHEDMMQEQHIQNVEPIDKMEPSSDAASMMVEGVHEHKTLDTHEETTLELEQDHKIICDYREETILEGSRMMDSGVKRASATLEVDETQAAVVIQNQKIFDVDKQLAMKERQDLRIIVENNKMDISKGADIMVCDAHQINPTSIEVNGVRSTKGTQNQEPFNDKKVMEERIEFITDRIGISLEAAYNAAAAGGVNTFAVAMDDIESTHNKEASNMELLSTADKQHHGVENVNEKRILEDTSMAGSGELNSDATALEVNIAGSREGTMNQCAFGAEKEAVVPEKEDQGTADENTKKDLADIDALECGGVKPDEAGNMFHGTLHTAQASNIAGFEISSENKQKEASFGKRNITDVECSESNKTVMEPEEACPPELENPVEVKQENLENGIEMSICRDNDKESEKDRTSAEVTITPNLEKQHEIGNGLAEESTKSCEKLASNPKNTGCLLKLGKSSIEEVKRTYNTRSMYLKDIKESLGRIRAEPLNRVQTTCVGNFSRHAVQEPNSVCKEIRVPLRDSARDSGRERAPESVLTSPPEETSRWRQEQYALQILEEVQNSRIAEKTRMEMEIRVLKAQIASMERQMMNLDHFAEVKSRSKRH